MINFENKDTMVKRTLVKQKRPRKIRDLFLWYLPDLNRGHTDFQSDALPTELRYLP